MLTPCLKFGAAKLRWTKHTRWRERIRHRRACRAAPLTPSSSEQTMIASHPFPGRPPRRAPRALRANRHRLDSASVRRLKAALACLALGYALAWIEVLLEFLVLPAPENAAGGVPPLLAAVLARVLLGALYLFVALRHRWARWLTVTLGFLSAIFVTPMLPGEWQILPAASLVTGLGMLCRLAAAILLALPMRERCNVA
jgi:peptidoglycan/LPS O-acetylase OafA/YrhL